MFQVDASFGLVYESHSYFVEMQLACCTWLLFLVSIHMHVRYRQSRRDTDVNSCFHTWGDEMTMFFSDFRKKRIFIEPLALSVWPPSLA